MSTRMHAHASGVLALLLLSWPLPTRCEPEAEVPATKPSEPGDSALPPGAGEELAVPPSAAPGLAVPPSAAPGLAVPPSAAPGLAVPPAPELAVPPSAGDSANSAEDLAVSAADGAPLQVDEQSKAAKHDPARGERLYFERCAVCHGRTGKGDGPTARRLDPKPRDLTRGVYKIRSTTSGSLPTDADIYRTITRGIAGTSMPGWDGLPSEDRWHLVSYLKSISPRFAKKRRMTLVAIPAAPPITPALVAKGRQAYMTMECGKCHGADGRADGPAARTLVDDRGDRIYPFDMTRGWKLKSGNASEDVFRVLHTGLDGTPMPSYAGVLAEEDAWALIFFVRSLFVDMPATVP